MLFCLDSIHYNYKSCKDLNSEEKCIAMKFINHHGVTAPTFLKTQSPLKKAVTKHTKSKAKK